MKTPWIVITLGIFLFLAGIFRLIGQVVPTLTVAAFSIVAVLVSLVDLFEVLKFKKLYQTLAFILAMVFFVVSLSFWVFPFPLLLDQKFVPKIGDAFTIWGIAFVIAIFGIKELKTSTAQISVPEPSTVLTPKPMSDKEIEYLMTKHEFEKMMELNNIIEDLKIIDAKTYPYKRVHNGWALFHDVILQYWDSRQEPFHDSLNRQTHIEFMSKLATAIETSANLADTDPNTFKDTEIKMWNENYHVTIQPANYDPHIPNIKQAQSELLDALNTWDSLKNQITERYEQSRVK